MFGWYCEVDAWSRFWRWNLIKICVWICDMNSTLGSVVPLAMFFFYIKTLYRIAYQPLTGLNIKIYYISNLKYIYNSTYVWDIKYISNIKTLRRITYHSLLGSNIKIKPKVAKIIMARKEVENDQNSFLKYSWIYMAHMCIFSSLASDYSSLINLARKIKLVNLPDHIYLGIRLINKVEFL